VLEGAASTGHTTGPGGSFERAHLREGSLLWLRTGRGAWHAESVGQDEVAAGRGDEEFRGVLVWVNLARKDKQAEPRALVLHREQIPVRSEGDATVRVLVGEGSPVELRTPGLILDVELPGAGQVTTPGRQGSRPSPTSWRGRPPSGRAGVEPGRRSWSCSVRARS
jgi:redox-sensitive bicupin YhaK (pirin superfamily)